MEARTILAIVLSLVVLLTYQMFFAPQPVPPPPKPDAAAENKPQQAAKEAAKPEILQKTQVAPKTVFKPAVPPRDIKVETAHYIAVFSTKGGALKSFQLKGYAQDCVKCAYDIYPIVKNFITGSKDKQKPKSDAYVDLVNVKEGMPYPLAITFPESSADIAPDSIYETETTKLDLMGTREKQRLVFLQSSETIKVEKIFTFNPENYSIGLEVKVHNLTNSPINQTAKLSWQQFFDIKQEYDDYAHEGPVVSLAGSIEREEVRNLDKEKILGPNVLWGAYENKYFLASFIPENPSLTNVIMSRDANDMVSVGIKGKKEVIPGGQSGLFNYSLYLGPKKYNQLKLQNVGLEDSIDFGSWFKWLAIPLLWCLNFIHNFVGNYGVVIIILTILIKIIFWPLGNMSYRSMNEMKNLQPKIAALKEKHKNDQAKIGQETMALYRAHKVNPFSGCLPIIIQIPVFFGLYQALLYSIELRHSPFIWWIQDLSAKDPYYITPIVMGISQFVMQKMTPMMGDPLQQKIMLLMPVIFTFFFLNFPSGLVIYWLFNNILSIGQQYYMNKKLANK